MTGTQTDTIVSTKRTAALDRPPHVMTGDRFCSKCGYNLVGQEIVREEHYDLLIIRCPECATVTGLQEYPRLGTWSARSGIVLAALWLLLLLCLWPATSGIMLGFGVGMADEGSLNYAQHLSALQAQAEAAAAAESPQPTPPQTPPASQQIINIPGDGGASSTTSSC